MTQNEPDEIALSKQADNLPEAGNQPGEDRPQLGVLQVLGSVLAAMFGVQSSKNQQRDFEQGNAGVFIAAGVIFGLVFVAAIYLVVSLVLSQVS